MLPTTNIQQIPTTTPAVFAFEITGEVTSHDMQQMSTFMLDAFDVFDKVSMLLILAGYEGSEFAAGLNWDSIKAQMKSLTNVEQYVVVGAPSAAEKLIEGLNALIPVDAKTFETSEIEDAWRTIGAAPLAQ